MNAYQLKKFQIRFYILNLLLLLSATSYASKTEENVTVNELKRELKKITADLRYTTVAFSNSEKKNIYPVKRARINYPLGSLTKSITSSSLLKVVYDLNEKDLKATKKFLMTKPISAILKGKKLYNDLLNFEDTEKFAKKKPIDWMDQTTLHQLLTHTSGLDDYYSIENLQANFGVKYTTEPLPIDPIVAIQSSSFDPERKYKYSNTNYLLIAKILEEISGKKYGELLDELNLKDTISLDEGVLPKETCMVSPNEKFTDNLQNAFGSGHLIANISDLLSFTDSIFSSDNPYTLLLEKTVETQDPDTKYGYGLNLQEEETKLGKMVYHNGDIGGTHNVLIYFPGHNLTIIVLSSYEEEYTKVVSAIFQII